MPQGVAGLWVHATPPVSRSVPLTFWQVIVDTSGTDESRLNDRVVWLNVRSVTTAGEPATTPVGSAFTPAAERILLAAMELFADHGYEGASIRQIAEAADVSPGLVMHHYGSKAGLRAACDHYTTALTRDAFELLGSMVMGSTDGSTVDASDGATGAVQGPIGIALAYAGRAVIDGTEAGDALVDDIVATVIQTQNDLVESGVMSPTNDPTMRAVLLTIFDLAPAILARQVERLTGSDPRTADGMARMVRTAVALYTTPLLTGKGITPHD